MSLSDFPGALSQLQEVTRRLSVDSAETPFIDVATEYHSYIKKMGSASLNVVLPAVPLTHLCETIEMAVHSQAHGELSDSLNFVYLAIKLIQDESLTPFLPPLKPPLLHVIGQREDQKKLPDAWENIPPDHSNRRRSPTRETAIDTSLGGKSGQKSGSDDAPPPPPPPEKGD